MRITPLALVGQQIYNLDQQSSSLGNLQQQASTGLRILRPSDDPSGTISVLVTQAQDGWQQADQGNVQAAQNWLEQANSALLQVSNVFTQAKQIALQGASSTNDATTDQALASQVTQLINQLLSLANSQSDGRYLFGGTATGQAPFAVTAQDASGNPQTVSYQGSADSASIAFGGGESVKTLYAGDSVFQSSGKDAFAELIGLRNDLLNTAGLTSTDQVQALSQRAGGLDQAHQGILNSVGEMSASLAELQTLNQQLTSQHLQNQTRISGLQSADIAAVATSLSSQQALFTDTLAVTARMFRQSLIDYL